MSYVTIMGPRPLNIKTSSFLSKNQQTLSFPKLCGSFERFNWDVIKEEDGNLMIYGL